MEIDNYNYVLAGSKDLNAAIAEYNRLKFQNDIDQYLMSHLFNSRDFSFIKDGFNVLDTGFGAGCFTEHILDSSECKDISITAVDMLEPLMKYALTQMEQKRASCINPIVDNFLSLEKVEDESQDLAVTRYTFQHVPFQIDEYLTALKKKLKPEGKLFIIDGDNISTNIQTDDRVFNKQVVDISYGLDSFHPQSCPFIHEKLLDCGFDIIETRHHLSVFKDMKDKVLEHKVWQMRFNKLKPLITSILGSEIACENYIRDFLAAILIKNKMYYMNQFGFLAKK